MNISHVCIGLIISSFKTREGQYVHKEIHHRDFKFLRS